MQLLPRLTIAGYCVGLPIGMQLMGRPWAESALLQAGAALEANLPSMSQPKAAFDNLAE